MEKQNVGGRTISPKIRGEAADWYSRMFPSLDGGAAWVLEEFPHLHQATIEEMRGKFTRGELRMILEVLNGQLAALVVLGSHGGQNIRLSICNSFECRPGSCAQWGVDKSLNAKLAGLTRWQLSCLEIWAGAFWEKHYQSCTLDEYCKTLEN